MKRRSKKLPYGIEYAGTCGVTAACKDAVMRLIQYGDQITHARILSHSNQHCLLLTVNCGDLIAVKSGFTSGYGGEGPTGFSFVLQLLEIHGAKIEEYDVGEDVIQRLDCSSLTVGDIETIDKARPVWPVRWRDCVFHEGWKNGSMWQEFRPVMPWGIIDSRISDLALSFFEHPDKSLLTAYRRLEDGLRKRMGSNEHGVKLFSDAFHGEKARLIWEGLSDNERTGRANLFTGAYMAYRNPRAHRELKNDANRQLAEFLLLNHLFALEKEACDRQEETGSAKKTSAKQNGANIRLQTHRVQGV